MYLTDEEQDEQGENIAQQNCDHEDTSVEHIGTVNRNGSVATAVVCHDCGAQWPTGQYDSIL